MFSDNYVTIENMHYYRDGRPIFKGVNLAIPRGKITVVMGPSGTGKTTLLNLIGKQLEPSRGKIIVDGVHLAQLNRSELYTLRKKMGILFQSGALFTHLSVFENIAFPLREHTALTEEMIRNIVLMKLESVGLRGARNLMPSQLSGGMARRVALARALVLDPELMMYDEPFTGQDPVSMGVLVKLIRLMNQALGITSIVVSHDVQEALSIADYVYILSEGVVVGQGTPDEITRSELPNVRQFLKGLPDGPVPFHYQAPSVEADFLGV